ncbi:hypothetical protein HDU97_008088 [Phlyctochytrium planicorne]|nr:hypothetical protein HDU97_008088 [Phlyctochytrium planicorne]
MASTKQTSTFAVVYNTGAKVVERAGPVVSAVQTYTYAGVSYAKAILDRYPPLKAFVYTLAGTSAIPLAVFMAYAGIILAICLSVAGTGVALVQGGFMVFGGFVLFWFLAGAFIFTSIATFWFTAAYFAFQVAKAIERSSSAN